MITTEYHPLVHQAFELSAQALLQLLIRADALRKPERFQQMLDACLADARGRKGQENIDYPQAPYLGHLAQRLRALDTGPLQQQASGGEEIAREIRRARLELIAREKKLAQE